MNWERVVQLGVLMFLLTLALQSCSKDEAPSSSQQQGGGLSASPSSVTVSTNQTRTTAISGGVAPYVIASAPSASLATAQLMNANLDTAILSITGVSMATGSTSVRVRDSSPPPERQVTVGIQKIQ